MPPYREEFTCFSGRMLHLHFVITIELHPHAYTNHGVHSHWTRQTSPSVDGEVTLSPFKSLRLLRHSLSQDTPTLSLLASPKTILDPSVSSAASLTPRDSLLPSGRRLLRQDRVVH
ncbi:hypothetical protein BDV09DRAFT_89473 [Aspergillus tetrazonus]